MNLDSPEGLSRPFSTQQDSYSDCKHRVNFVRASELFDARTDRRDREGLDFENDGPTEATDEQVREAIEQFEREQAESEQAEATDEEVREAIFADEDEHGRTAREVAEIEGER